jgi:Na+-driven multidrug efflux pump
MIMPVVAINQGGQPIIGYNYGARKFDRVTSTLKYSILAATAISTLGFLVAHLFSTPLAALFSGGDKELISVGSQMLKIILMFLPVVGIQIVGAGYFQAIGKAAQSAILSLSRQVLFLIPALYILPNFFGLEGVLASAPVADLLSTIVTGLWLFFEVRRLLQKHEKYREIPESIPEE